jgi:hypothetical protein
MNTKDIHSAAQALGRLGGLAKSKAKAKAVRENGKLGGRPVGSKDSKPRKPRRTVGQRGTTYTLGIPGTRVYYRRQTEKEQR